MLAFVGAVEQNLLGFATSKLSKFPRMAGHLTKALQSKDEHDE
jgi:hypothetical protein